MFIASGKPHVEMDIFIDDVECSLDSGYTIGTDATHWMPLPAWPELQQKATEGVAGKAEEMLLAVPMPQKERDLVRDFAEKQKDMQLWIARVAKSGENFLVGMRREAIDIAANWSEEDEKGHEAKGRRQNGTVGSGDMDAANDPTRCVGQRRGDRDCRDNRRADAAQDPAVAGIPG